MVDNFKPDNNQVPPLPKGYTKKENNDVPPLPAGYVKKKDDGGTATAVGLTTESPFTLQSKSLGDLLDPIKSIPDRAFVDVPGLGKQEIVEKTKVAIPYERVASKQQYAKELQARVNAKTFTPEDVDIVSKSMDVAPAAATAFLDGKPQTGLVLDLNDKKAKFSTQLQEILQKANNDLGRQDDYEAVFATPETVSAYLNQLDGLYQEKIQREIEQAPKEETRGVSASPLGGAAPIETIVARGSTDPLYDEIRNRNQLTLSSLKGVLGKHLVKTKALDTSKSVEERVNEIAGLADPLKSKNISEAIANRGFGDGEDFNRDMTLINAQKGYIELGVNQEIGEKVRYNEALVGSLIEEYNDKVAAGTATEEDKKLYQDKIDAINTETNTFKKDYQDESKLLQKYPVIQKKRIIDLLNDFNALKSGNVTNNDGRMANVSKEEFLRNNGYDPNDQIVKDAMEATNLQKDYTMFGGFGRSVGDVFVNMAKGVGDITGIRDDLDRLADKEQDELFPRQVGSMDQYQLDNTTKIVQNISNTTGQVLGQGIAQWATAGVGRFAGMGRLAASNVGFWSSGALSTYDQAYKDSYDFVESDSGRITYAGLNSLFAAATEKIFGESKILEQIPGFKATIREFASKVGTPGFTDDLARELLAKAKNQYVQGAMQFGKNIGQEVIEESATSLFESASRFVFGDPNMSMEQALADVKETAIQTAMGMPVVGVFGARADIMRERNMAAKSTIYNAALYHDEAMDAINKGFEKKLYSPEERDEKIKVLNTARQALAATAQNERVSGVKLTRPQRELYVANLTAESILEGQKEIVTDPVMQKPIDEKIAALKEQREGIISGEVRIDENRNFITPAMPVKEGETKPEQGGELAVGDIVKSGNELGKIIAISNNEVTVADPNNPNKISWWNKADILSSQTQKNENEKREADGGQQQEGSQPTPENQEEGSQEENVLTQQDAATPAQEGAASSSEPQGRFAAFKQRKQAEQSQTLTPSEKTEWANLSREEKLALAKQNLPQVDKMTESEVVKAADTRAKELLEKRRATTTGEGQGNVNTPQGEAGDVAVQAKEIADLAIANGKLGEIDKTGMESNPVAAPTTTANQPIQQIENGTQKQGTETPIQESTPATGQGNAKTSATVLEEEFKDSNVKQVVYRADTGGRFSSGNTGATFFTSNRNYAQSYAEDLKGNKISEVRAYRVNLKNPLVVSMQKDYAELASGQLLSRAIREGYDGIIAKDDTVKDGEVGVDEIVVFDNSQFKEINETPQGNAKTTPAVQQQPSQQNIENENAIADDPNEQQFIEQNLAEQDNIEQEPIIKNIERIAENPEGKSSKELDDAERQAVGVINDGTGVVNVPIDEISTNEQEYQGRKNQFSERSARNVAENFSQVKFDPIVLFKHPDGKTYVLSGHSRLEGMKRRKAKTIPARFYEGTPEQAKDFALGSNKLATLQTDLENAAYYREKINKGAAYDAVLKEAKENEQQGTATRIVNFAYLNPKGKTIQALEALEEGEGDTKSNLQNVAGKIGSIRAKNDHLTDAHENELFDYFTDDKDNIPTDKDIVDQNNALNRSIGAVKFNPEEPLNLNRFVNKSPARIEWEKEKKEIDSALTEARRDVKPDRKTGWNGLKERAIASLIRGAKTKESIDQATSDFDNNVNGIKDAYNKALEKKKQEVVALENKLAKHLLREKDVNEGDKNQGSLFATASEGNSDVQEMKGIIQQIMDEDGVTSLDEIKKIAQQELGDLYNPDLIDDAFNEITEETKKEFASANEVTTGVVKRINTFIANTFGIKGNNVVTLKDEAAVRQLATMLGGDEIKFKYEKVKAAVIGAVAMLHPVKINGGDTINNQKQRTEQVRDKNNPEIKIIKKLFDDYYGVNNETVPQEVLERAIKVWESYGKPKINLDSTDKRAFYNPEGKFIGNINNVDDFIAEMAHSAQFISKAELNQRDYNSKEEYDATEYDRVGSVEYDAHKFIEPIMANFIFSGEKGDDVINDMFFSDEKSKEAKEVLSKYDIVFMQKDDGVILGFTHDNKIYLNGEALNPNTPIHEAGHLWLKWAKDNASNLFERGMELVSAPGNRYLAKVKANPFYQAEASKLGKEGSRAYDNYMKEEALAMAIGDKGAQFVVEARRKSFTDWANQLFDAIAKAVGFKGITGAEIQNLTFDDFAKRVAADILKGGELASQQQDGKTREQEITELAEKIKKDEINYLDAVDGRDQDFIDDLQKEMFKDTKKKIPSLDEEGFKQSVKRAKEFGLSQQEIISDRSTNKKLTKREMQIIDEVFAETREDDKAYAELKEALKEISKGLRPKGVIKSLLVSDVTDMVKELVKASKASYQVVSNQQLEDIADYIVLHIDLDDAAKYLNNMIDVSIADVKQLVRAKTIIKLQEAGKQKEATDMVLAMADEATAFGRSNQSLKRAYEILGSKGNAKIKTAFAKKYADKIKEEAERRTRSMGDKIGDLEAEIQGLNQKIHKMTQTSPSMVDKLKELIDKICNVRNKKP